MAFRHSKDTRIYVAELDMSGVASSFNLSPIRNMPETTVLQDQGRKHSVDIEDGTWEAEIVWDDDYDDELDAVGRGGEKVISSYWGGDALDRRGHGMISAIGEAYQLRSSIADVVRGRVTGKANGLIYDIRSLGPSATLAATGNGSSIDGAASSADGAVFFWHVLAWSASGGNAQWQIQFQDSPDDSVWSSLGAAQNISAVGGGSLTVSGTVERYLRRRLVLDATSGSITIQAGVARL